MNATQAKAIVKYRGYFFTRILKQQVEISRCKEIEFGWYVCFSLKDADPLFGKAIYMPTCFIVDEKTKTYYIDYCDYPHESFIKIIKEKRNERLFVFRKKMLNFIRDTYEKLLFLLLFRGKN